MCEFPTTEEKNFQSSPLRRLEPWTPPPPPACLAPLLIQGHFAAFLYLFCFFVFHHPPHTHQPSSLPLINTGLVNKHLSGKLNTPLQRTPRLAERDGHGALGFIH